MYLWRLAVVVTALFVSASAWSEAPDGFSQWTVRNNSGDDVLVSFYVKGTDIEHEQGVLEAGKSASYKVSCKAGQRICYGVVVADEYDEWFDLEENADNLELEDGIPEPEGWGVRLGKDACTDCCATCGRPPRTVGLRN